MVGRPRPGGLTAPPPQVLTLESDRYPTSLRDLRDPPPQLFLRGNTGLLKGRMVAIVGSRAATPVGRRAAEQMARELSEAGLTVVSGMALGIDGAAHRGALLGSGGTVAVLGAGPDRPYPAGNREIFNTIADRGLLLSEFPPGEPARPYHFPRRNRLIAALAAAIVVVEAARRSGALITVDHALDLGREVFALPGSVENPQAEGTNALLRDGAHLVTCAGDLLETLGWSVPAPLSPQSELELGPSTFLGRRPCSLDELVGMTGWPPARLLPHLTRLEMEGRIVRSAEGWHTR